MKFDINNTGQYRASCPVYLDKQLIIQVAANAYNDLYQSPRSAL